MDKDLAKIENFLKEIVSKVGEEIRDKYIKNKYKIISYKEKNDCVTTLDIGCEEYLINKISKKFPKYNILSEERGYLNNNSDFTFVIDPLDGTKELIRGISDFNVLVGLQYKNQILIGVVYRVIDKELYWSRENNGSYLNNKRIYVSKNSEILNSYIYVIFPTSFIKEEKSKEMWNKIYLLSRNVYRIKGMGRVSSALCLVAKGSFEGFYNPLGVTKGIWDILPSALILKEAGGTITDFKGDELRFDDDLSKGIIASNGHIHKNLLSVL